MVVRNIVAVLNLGKSVLFFGEGDDAVLEVKFKDGPNSLSEIKGMCRKARYQELTEAF